MTIFYRANGEILSSCEHDAPESVKAAWAEVGCHNLPGFCNPNDHYIQDGQICHIPPLQEWEHFDFNRKEVVASADERWLYVRRDRKRLLSESDWTQMPDVPLATKEVWAAYRQALRDITLQPDPFNIVWPVAPSN